MDELIERLQLKRDVWRGTEFGDDICELLDEAADALEAMRAEVECVTCELMDAITRADKLAEALRLALNSHGKTLLTDPPQDAWKVNRVEEIGRALLRDQEEGHEQ